MEYNGEPTTCSGVGLYMGLSQRSVMCHIKQSLSTDLWCWTSYKSPDFVAASGSEMVPKSFRKVLKENNALPLLMIQYTQIYAVVSVGSSSEANNILSWLSNYATFNNLFRLLNLIKEPVITVADQSLIWKDFSTLSAVFITVF